MKQLTRVDKAKLIDLREIFETVLISNQYHWEKDKDFIFYINRDNKTSRYRRKSEEGSNIDFIIKYFNMNFIEAVNWLLSKNRKYSIKKEENKPVVKGEREDIKTFIKDNYIDNNYGSYRYLVGVRGIDADIFHFFDKKGLIFRGTRPGGKYESYMDRQIKNDYTLSYFVYKNPWTNEITGLSGRENRDFMKIIGKENFRINFSDCLYGFNFLKGEAKTLTLFEAPIDLLSYLTIFKGNNKLDNNLFSATGGSNKKLMLHLIDEFIENGGEKIIFCFDNDKFGNDTFDFIEMKYGLKLKVVRELPKFGKDWNEQLKGENKNGIYGK